MGIIGSEASLDRLSPTPIFQQIKAILERAIATGELSAHQRIPSERELSAALGVSRMTIRQAMLEMMSDGTLYTRSGKGTYVADRKIEQPLQRLSSFTEDITARGMRPASQVLAQELLSAPLELAGALQVAPGSELVRIRRLRLANEQPLALETAHLPHALCPGLLRCDLSRNSLYEVLRTEYGVVTGSAKQTIEASQPVEEERQLLHLPDGVPVLRIDRLTSSVDGRLVEFVRSVYRGDRFQLHVELR